VLKRVFLSCFACRRSMRRSAVWCATGSQEKPFQEKEQVLWQKLEATISGWTAILTVSSVWLSLISQPGKIFSSRR